MKNRTPKVILISKSDSKIIIGRYKTRWITWEEHELKIGNRRQGQSAMAQYNYNI